MPATSNNDSALASSSDTDDPRPAKRARLETARITAKFKEGDWAVTRSLYRDKYCKQHSVPVKITKVEYDEDESKWYYVGDMESLHGHAFVVHCSEDSLTKPDLAIGDLVRGIAQEDHEASATVLGYERGEGNELEYYIGWPDMTNKREEPIKVSE